MMSGLNIHTMLGQFGHIIYHFRCSEVVKPLPVTPHPLLNMLKEAVNFIKIVTSLPLVFLVLTMWFRMSRTPFLLGIALLVGLKKQVKFMNISTEHILQCIQLEPLADARGRIVVMMTENVTYQSFVQLGYIDVRNHHQSKST